MKIIVTHSSPDMDAITSVWLIRKFLPGWENAVVEFVPAGERLRGMNQESGIKNQEENKTKNHNSLFIIHDSVIEKINEDEVIHVDTGLGPLDHHQTASDKVCGASLTFDFVKRVSAFAKASTFVGTSADRSADKQNSKKWKDRMDAVGRMVKVIVDIDHFKEVFRKDPLADYHEFDLAGILDGLKFQFPNQDDYFVEFVSKCLDAVLHEFENRIWAEKEIAENGIKFETRFGKGMGFETINDSVVKLAQKMGYAIAVRKDPRKGYVRVKARPSEIKSSKLKVQSEGIDLTLAYEELRRLDPAATWFLHIGKKMLLNGSVKNPKMRPTKLSLEQIIKVLEKV